MSGTAKVIKQQDKQLLLMLRILRELSIKAASGLAHRRPSLFV
jgi:hypothetical protein